MSRLLLLLPFIVVACGRGEMPSMPSASSSKPAAAADAKPDLMIDDVVVPTREYYDALLVRRFGLLDTTSGAAKTQILYINFDGGTVTKGYGADQSFIPCRSQANIPAAKFSPTERESILNLVQQYYNEANARLVVTNVRPKSGEFTTMMVGGTYGDLGCLDRGSVLGVAPLDTGNSNPSDIGFAFTERVSSLKIVAQTIAHEAGHSFGLDHVDNRECLMYASATSDQLGFRKGRVARSAKIQDGPLVLQQNLGTGNGAVVSGPSAPIPSSTPAPVPTTGPIATLPNLPPNLANLPGISQIGGLGKLIPDLLPTQILNVSSLLPVLQNMLPGGIGGLDGIDRLVTVVQLAAQAANKQPAAGTSGANSLINLLGSAATSQSTVSTVSAVATMAGQPEIGLLLQMLQPMIASKTTAAQTSQLTEQMPLGALPNFAQLLQLPKYSNMNDMLTMLNGHAQVVNNNFTGTTKQSLLTMLKVGYAQSYLQGFAQ